MRFKEKILKHENSAVFLLTYAFLLAMHIFIKPSDGDDAFFINAARNNTYVEFIVNYYLTWSGRIVPNSFAYLLFDNYFWLWKIINPLFIMLCSFSGLRVLNKKVTTIDFIMFLSFILCLNIEILQYAIFWATGSLFYLWPVATALFIMIPFADAIFKDTYNFKYYGIYIIFTVISSTSNEQVSLCLIGFSIIFYVAMFLKKKSISYKHVIITVIMLICSFILFIAKGNSIRFYKEIEHWYPDFHSLTFYEHFLVGFRWTFDVLFNVMSILIVFLGILILYCYYSKYKKLSFSFCMLTTMCLFSIASMLISQYVGSILFTFKEYTNIISIVPYLFWIVTLFLIILMLVKLNKPVYILLIFAGICSIVVMCFSPTIYASGLRTTFILGVFIIMIITNILNLYPKIKIPFLVFGIMPLAIVNLTNMVLHFLNYMNLI
jgi:hypothetical protein